MILFKNFATALAFFFLASSAIAQDLTILFTNDLHSSFLPHPASGGYARLATAIETVRKRAPQDTLLLDAGDFSMGTLFHTLYTTDAAELRLMGLMGYDAVTLGNHEFDFRPEGLRQMLLSARHSRDAVPPVVVSNLLDLDQFKDYPVQPYLVLERAGLKIGIFGLLGKDALDDTPNAAPLRFESVMTAAKRVVQYLRAEEKVDLVIALSHSGLSSDPKHSEDEILPREVPGIDVVISGHSHTVVHTPRLIGKTWVVSSGIFGRYLGILKLGRAPGGGFRQIAYEVKEITPDFASDEEVARKIDEFARRVDVTYLKDSPFKTATVLATAAFDFERLDYAYQTPGEIGLGNLVTDSFRQRVRKIPGRENEPVDVVVHALGMIRGTLLKGPITTADVFQVLSLGIGEDQRAGYPLIECYLTGRELRDMMEVEATVGPLKPDAHLQIAGARFFFNPHRLPTERVTRVEIQTASGQYVPVENERIYRGVASLYAAKMFNVVDALAHGMLSIKLRNKAGKIVEHAEELILDSDPERPGVQEIKEWEALADYLAELKTVPARYSKPEGRIISEPSWNPLKLFGPIFAGVSALVVTLGAAVVWLIRKLLRRRAGR